MHFIRNIERILDSDAITSGISKSFIRFPNEEDEFYYNRVSHLHCSNKKIVEIGDLSQVQNLTKLKKLYLSRNKISIIEGLHDLTQLQELHIDHQAVDTKNGRLKSLNISYNELTRLEESLKILSNMVGLLELDISNNPVIKDLHYKDDVVASCSTLKILNGREIYLDSKIMLTILKRRSRKRGTQELKNNDETN
ncbi:unnamed protein product [Lepeophtheirus salmonis]|uniref:Dynein axonemal assembly factor 1 homolog n=1 Tax=Lepeophtheirus salmonis TaxID=72036 RepID=A0A7R8CXS9_LEPSM|nr:unnamed protein product [Lepeophtheirus salmonis]CAF2964877.1 unnamed protein product [Lepeophtheirus salmonis]